MDSFVAKNASCARALRFWPRHAVCAGLVLAAVMLLGAARAEAYPQWQFSTDNTHCNQ